MKLKHYYNRIAGQIRESQQDLENLVCKSLVSKIMNCLGVNYPAKKLPDPSTSMSHISEILLGQQQPITYLPFILQNLSVHPNDYMKFYYLDTLTNQLYMDALINTICTFYKRKIQFIFDFSIANFTEPCLQPTIYVEYQIYKGVEYCISSILYYQPFNGEMEVEDFMSILLDTIYILNPEKCLQYLTLKLAAGVTTIPWSASKEIKIIPCYGGRYDALSEYQGLAVNYRQGRTMETTVSNNPPVFTLTEGSKAIFTHDNRFQADVSQLLSMLNIQ